jgi:hypothetical protein
MDERTGQLSTDDFMDLATLHKIDTSYYHQKCTGPMTTTNNEKTYTSTCSLCGIAVVTSRAAVSRNGGK